MHSSTVELSRSVFVLLIRKLSQEERAVRGHIQRPYTTNRMVTLPSKRYAFQSGGPTSGTFQRDTAWWILSMGHIM